MKSNGQIIPVQLRLDSGVLKICIDGSEKDCGQILKHLKVVRQPIKMTEPDMFATIIDRCYRSNNDPVDLTELGISVTNLVFEKTLQKLKQWDWDTKRILISEKQLTRK
ncbi:MAG: hypothetical protein ABIJ81_02165 [Patescibacteria group bacterium]